MTRQREREIIGETREIMGMREREKGKNRELNKQRDTDRGKVQTHGHKFNKD